MSIKMREHELNGNTFCQCHLGNLWYRQGLTPSYPQGSAWELISNNASKVSVGPLDQVSVTTVSRSKQAVMELKVKQNLKDIKRNKKRNCIYSKTGVPSIKRIQINFT